MEVSKYHYYFSMRKIRHSTCFRRAAQSDPKWRHSSAKLDRLGRDAPGVGATVKLLAILKIAVIVLQLGKLDLTSPVGKKMLTMLAAVAEMEGDLLVERTQAGLARAKNEGKTLGRPSKTTAEQRAEIIAKYAAG
ncbi:Resolvase, N terminal domain [Duganella sacchari]|uniref:Resolvase, N terminal domain n=1 Tax=Duganella sacchari TaxID=551987 RepID=A0A1M7R875_9BURK|nr:recombinase family protein [Duganella sacchari]SHN42524.1 Resolvase, N terminal domain [Duganella sacchari]